MRTVTILSVFFFGLGVFWVFQDSQVQGQPGSGGRGGQQQAGQPGGGQRGGSPGTAAQQQGGRGGQSVAGQGDRPVRPMPPVRPAQPGTANQSTRPTQPVAEQNRQGQQSVAGQNPQNRQGQQPVAGQNPQTRQGQQPAAGQNQQNRQGQQPREQNAGQQQRQQVQTTEGRQRPQTAEPLVRPFGETGAAETPVIGFGQRPVQQTAQGGRSGQQQGGQQRDAAAQANQQAVIAAREANTARQTAVYDNVPSALRDNQSFAWFFEYDTDRDGQLTMLEYVNGCGGTWTAAIAKEYLFLDRNGDGFVTMDEALASIREDDERRAQEVREQTESAGSSGRNSPSGQSTAGRSSGERSLRERYSGSMETRSRTPTAADQRNTGRPPTANQNFVSPRNQSTMGPAGRDNQGSQDSRRRGL